MNAARTALLVPLLAVLAVSGCQIRGAGGGNSVESDELQAESQRSADKLADLKNQNVSLAAQLMAAKEELAKCQSSPSIGTQLKKKMIDIEGIEGASKTESGGLALNEDFAFAKGSADLSPEGKKSIEKIAARLNQGEYAGAKVVVEGHTDDSPVARASTKEKYGDNWGLSGARSASVIRALQAAGIDAKRLRGHFRGEYAPRGADKNANRRVEIYLGD